MKEIKYYSLIFLLVLLACRQPYEPPPIKADYNFLVVEGVINTTPNSSTTILLSRTRNLADTFLTSPERFAQIEIESGSGNLYNLMEGEPGIYTSNQLTLNPNQTYRLHIWVGNDQFISDFVTVKNTPPIDSITWKRDDGVTLYANTHDPQNNTRYYRWDFIETWQYRSVYETDMGVQNGMIYFRDSTNQIYNCWRSMNSTEILLASSVRLSQDVIDKMPLQIIPEKSEKLSVRYSMLLKQYALTEEAYKYWEILQKNTQKLGTLFDAQPSQLVSNIYNTTNPSEPVIGYISACNVQEKRIFIRNFEVFPWEGSFSSPACGAQKQIGVNPSNYLIYTHSDTTYSPYFFCCGGGGLVLARNECLDCRRRGGSTQKPSFW